jgi:hypothetical protein
VSTNALFADRVVDDYDTSMHVIGVHGSWTF